MFVRRAAVFAMSLVAGSVTLIATSTEEASAAMSVSVTRVNVGPNGAQPSARDISADGRYVVFGSRAEDLVPGDTNGRSDVFRYDVTNGSIVRLSASAGGVQGNRDSDNPVVSADGRYVAFSSPADNLVPGDANGAYDVFLCDTQTGTIARVSAEPNGSQFHSGYGSSGPAISADGRYVAYTSDLPTLVPGDTNNATDVFRYDTLAGTITRVSVSTSGAQANAPSHSPAVSADGRYVSYTSGASNITSGDTNGVADIFRSDTVTGTTIRVSRSSEGVQANGASGSAVLSGDGRIVVYGSAASNLVTDDTNDFSDVFRFDATAGTTTRVSTNLFGGQINGGSAEPSVSGDGRFVTFSSEASKIVGGDTNGARDVFLADTQSNAVAMASISSSGEHGDKGSEGAHLSVDGRHIVFHSYATNLVSDDSNGQMDLFVATLDGTPETTDPAGIAAAPVLVSLSTADAQSDRNSTDPTVSATGRYVAFASMATNLVAGDTNNRWDIFLRDTLANTTSRVSLSTGGAQPNEDASRPSISADGRYIAFDSSASNLVPGDTNGRTDVFLRDTSIGTTTRISGTSGGAQPNGDSAEPALSADGRYVVFWSGATNLVTGDTNGASDLFRYDITNGTVMRVSVTNSGTQANAASYGAAISEHGRYVAFTSNATNLVPGDVNGAPDAFRFDTATGSVLRIGKASARPALSADGRYVAYSYQGGAAYRYDSATGETVQVASSAGVVAISADGRYVAFDADSAAGVTYDANNGRDVFRVDAETGATMRLTETGEGVQANSHSGSPAISANGRYVAFWSYATNLTHCDANGNVIDVFLASADNPLTPPDHGLCALDAPSVVPGDGEITVRWQRPTVDPGYDVIEYTVTVQPGDHTVVADGGSIEATIPGLTNGTAYTAKVVATNAAGDSPASAPSAPVTPRTTPSAPLDVMATPSNGQLSVSWRAPASDGGAPITGYSVTAHPGDHTVGVAGGVTNTTIPGLTNGTAYTVTVTATNVAGDSAASAPSSSATPRTTPSAPTAVTATPGDGLIDVAWTASSSDGGSPITSYTVLAQPGDHILNVDSSASEASIPGLSNGTTYSVAVWATNASGNSPAGFANNGVTPHAPGAVVAYNSSRSVPAGGSAGVELAGYDASGGALSYAIVTPPTHGTLTGSAPHLVYTPDAGYTGPDAIGWSVSSSYGGSASATVTIDVRSDGTNTVSQTVDPGQTVATGSTVSQEEPAQAAVTSPSGGEVSITSSSGGDPGAPAPTGYGMVGTQYTIEAPPATAEDPLRFTFLLSASSLPSGVDPDHVTVFRNGAAIAPCADSSGTAAPDPCVASYTRNGDTITIEVLSSHASTWATGVKGAMTVTTTTPPAGTEGVVSTAYALKATGGTGTLRWSVADGVLPTGMKLSTSGSLSGTPQCATSAPGCAVGTSTFMVQVTDTSKPAKWGLATLTYTVRPMTITAPVLKPGRLWVSYPSTSFKAVGGGTPLAWSAVGLPAGLKISSSGAVSGTPTVAGTFPVTVKVQNTTATWRVATKQVTFVVAPMAITSTPVVPKAGKVGTYYSMTEAVAGGKGTKTWTVQSGSLPPGMKLNATSGAIAGTPTLAGTFTFTVKVRDSAIPQNSASATYTITIGPR